MAASDSIILNKNISHIPYDATLYGISTENDGLANSQALQALIDNVSNSGGGTIHIPSGVYVFSASAQNTIGQRCVKMKNNVYIVGDGSSTILKPSGETADGLDMFYFNDLNDLGTPNYLENCRFEDFVIDGEDSSCTNYTSCGKGFMFNLFKNCYWNRIIVKNTDATGFGVDCPIYGGISNCVAINCGKGAPSNQSPGASGFGIGYGYSLDETMFIYNCSARDNKHFGFFFEHQRRFSPQVYTAVNNKGFIIDSCMACGNYYNFGALQGIHVQYRNCFSNEANYHGFYIENSEQCSIIGCHSDTEIDSAFAIVANDNDPVEVNVRDIFIISCVSKYSDYGVRIVNYKSKASITRIFIQNNTFSAEIEKDIYTDGVIENIVLSNNTATLNQIQHMDSVQSLQDDTNTWSIKPNHIWKGKRLTAFGTSITYLCQNYNGGYLERLKNILGLTRVTNNGVSGAPMVNNTENGNGINYYIKNTPIYDDIVIIECCTNDFKLDVPLGTVTTINTDTFAGSLKDALNHLITTYPNIPIVIVCDPQRNNDSYDINYINKAGKKLIDYINMAILIGNTYGIPVCDLYRNSGINMQNLNTFTVDGLHPNENGYKVIGDCISGVIDTMSGSCLDNNINIDSEVRIDSEYYDISESINEEYKLIYKVGSTFYMVKSHRPIYLYQSDQGYSECYDIVVTSILSTTNKKFTNMILPSPTGVTDIDDIYCRTNTVREANQFIAANHDIFLYGSDTKILRKSFS